MVLITRIPDAGSLGTDWRVDAGTGHGLVSSQFTLTFVTHGVVQDDSADEVATIGLPAHAQANMGELPVRFPQANDGNPSCSGKFSPTLGQHASLLAPEDV